MTALRPEDEALLAGVVDMIPLGVWIARAPSGELVFTNAVFREIMGMDARGDVAVGGYAEPYGIRDREGAPYPEERMPFVRALVASRTIVSDDIVIHRPDGRKVDVRAIARPVHGADGVVTHVVILFEDMTAERAAEAARAEVDARTQAAQRLESLGTLASGVAHDFNNLLASISMIASRMRIREADPSRAADLRQIEGAVDSAAQLTRALLAFGRGGPARSSRFDVATVVRGVVDLVRRTFDRGIEVSFAAAGPAYVIGDPSHVEQACLNLAINARDAMAGGGRLAVTVEAVRLADPPLPLSPGDHVTITVSDTGPGVPRAIRHRIFEPYFTTRVEPERAGTGLGLATVYGVVQTFGGLVELLDNEPHGATFRLTLPAAVHVVASLPPPPAVEVVAGEGLILLVDDEPMLRAATRRSLEMLGYVVVEAKDGREALDAIAEHGARIVGVVLDAVMPRLGGRAVLEELRRSGSTLPVVLASGRIGPGESDELLALGAAEVLHKPFTAAELSQALARAIGARPGAAAARAAAAAS